MLRRRATWTAAIAATAAALTAAGGALAHGPRAPDAAEGDALGHSTLERTLAGGPPAESFQRLRIGPGEPYVVRDELGEPRPGRERRRRSLVYLAQLSDFQISDEESPARVEFLDRDPSGTASSAWRPQEALVALQVEYTIRQVNRFLDSPVEQGDGSRARMANAVLTGDQADNQQLNETGWVVSLLEGGVVDPGTGTADLQHPLCPESGELVRDFDDPRRYTGVQDYTDYLLADPHFYDPNDPRGVFAARGWPAFPGLMDRAQQPFTAEGLRVPSYVAFGNHDALAQGNSAAIAPFQLVATGCVKPLGGAEPSDPFSAFREPEDLLARALADPDEYMLVPRDPRRRYVDKREYKALHDTGAQEDAHGFDHVDPDELRASNGAASYYAFTPQPGIRYVVLDTVAEGGVVGESSNGNIDDPQFRWLERELAAAQERGELILVFAHHALGSLTARVPDELAPPCVSQEADVNPGCDRDPRASTPVHGGADLEALLHRFPNAIALIAGHSHENRVAPRPRAGGGGFWEIKSPAVVDWPTQHRLVELMDNRDGTLSIFGTMLDHGGPATAPEAADAGTLSLDELVALGRTLAYNDPQVGPGPGVDPEGGGTEPGPEGDPIDRNVELVIADPRAAADGDAGAGPTRERRRPRRRAEPERERERPTTFGATARDGGGGAGSGSLALTGRDVLALAALGALLAAAGVATRRRLAARG